ncbi:IS5 family transposase [Paenibacillus polymyxa]|uniref:IS5 family transposase n=1 Tax=Paenibacillus polymyxa TaxID=1406 RepID=UPI002AB4DF1E|nr:IS5 family transposase [Paenibacillus polymyxa]MDY8024971.1 IS5 family transposase [Paenibacillus polymyxa]
MPQLCEFTSMDQEQKGVKQAIGRSRGGLGTKIHAVVNALGNPLRFELTGSEVHHSVHGYEMLQVMKLTMKQVLADRAYDTNAIRVFLEDQQAIPVIPGKNNRRVSPKYDRDVYKERHLVECFFNKVKNYRRLVTRYNKLACTFKAFLILASYFSVACLSFKTRTKDLVTNQHITVKLKL